MPALEDRGEALLHPSQGVLPDGILLSRVHRVVPRCRDSEHPSSRVRVNNPSRNHRPKEPMGRAEEFIEERLNRPKTQNIFPFHHLPCRHSPTPIQVDVVRLNDGSDRELDLVEEIREDHRGVPALGDDSCCDNIRVRVAKVGVEGADREHPRAAKQIASEQLFGRCSGWKEIGMGNDCPRPRDVLIEVVQSGGWHVIPQARSQIEEFVKKL